MIVHTSTAREVKATTLTAILEHAIQGKAIGSGGQGACIVHVSADDWRHDPVQERSRTAGMIRVRVVCG